jgi:hypothetical protein
MHTIKYRNVLSCSEDEGSPFFQNFGKYQTTRRRIPEKNLSSHIVQNLFSKRASFDLGQKIMVYRLGAKTTVNVLSQVSCEQTACCFNEIVLVQKLIKSLQHLTLLFSRPVKVSINVL